MSLWSESVQSGETTWHIIKMCQRPAEVWDIGWPVHSGVMWIIPFSPECEAVLEMEGG